MKIESQEESSTELPSRIYLFQGLPKQEKMEWIVQKSVELGAYQIVPVSMKRCVVKLDAKKAAEEAGNDGRKFPESAAKQSGRSVIPEVIPVCTFKEALEQAKQLDVILVPYECAEGMKETKALLEKIWPGQSVGIFIGPEGGFEEAEIEQALAAGAHTITLGKRILRTETAGLTTLSVLMFHLEE